jgi:hypothetical protein
MQPPDSTEELNRRLSSLVEASRTNMALRQALLRDPMAVLAEHCIPLAPGLRLRFVEADATEILLPLPRYEGPV